MLQFLRITDRTCKHYSARPAGARICALRGERSGRGGAIHSPVLRDRRQSRRKRFFGPLGIGIVASAAIAVILAGNGAAPPSTVGAVAGVTGRPAAASGGQLGSGSPVAPSVLPLPTGSPAAEPASGDAETYDAPLPEDLTGYHWPLAKARLTVPFGPTP